MGRVIEREAQVGLAHRLEAGPAAAVTFPGVHQRQSKRAEALAGHCRDERLLVGEVAVQRRPGYPEGLADPRNAAFRPA